MTTLDLSCPECGVDLTMNLYQFGRTHYRQHINRLGEDGYPTDWGDRQTYAESDDPEGYGCQNCGTEWSIKDAKTLHDRVENSP